MYYVAFYKGRKTGNTPKALMFRFLDWLTRKVTKGKYSHCELVTPLQGSLYECTSSSYRDGGVRTVIMELPSESWDLVPVEMDDEEVWKFCREYKGASYDLLGAIGCVLRNDNNPDSWFCSELVAYILGFQESWRYDPNTLADVLKSK